jgi:hypothetical protein
MARGDEPVRQGAPTTPDDAVAMGFGQGKRRRVTMAAAVARREIQGLLATRAFRHMPFI